MLLSRELYCCRFSTGRLAGPRVRTPLMTLLRIGSLKFCQIGSYSSLAFWPQTSANSWLSRAASSWRRAFSSVMLVSYAQLATVLWYITSSALELKLCTKSCAPASSAAKFPGCRWGSSARAAGGGGSSSSSGDGYRRRENL